MTKEETAALFARVEEAFKGPGVIVLDDADLRSLLALAQAKGGGIKTLGDEPARDRDDLARAFHEAIHWDSDWPSEPEDVREDYRRGIDAVLRAQGDEPYDSQPAEDRLIAGLDAARGERTAPPSPLSPSPWPSDDEMIALMERQIDQIGGPPERTRVDRAILNVLRKSPALLAKCGTKLEELAADLGPCDHSVNVCVCDIRELARAALLAAGPRS